MKEFFLEVQSFLSLKEFVPKAPEKKSGVIRRKKPIRILTSDIDIDEERVASEKSRWDRVSLIIDKTDGMSLVEYQDDVIVLHIAKPRKTPALPDGYFFKGGVAREVLRSALHPEFRPIPFRDYDLVRFSELTDEKDHSLSLKHMYEDYCFGRGVEVVESSSEYFASRDLTCNELLYQYPEIRCTKSCLFDLWEGSLIASQYRTNIDGTIDSTTGIKMLRFKAEAITLGIPNAIFHLQKPLVASWFDVALHLNRSLVMSEGTTLEFLELLWRYGVFPSHFEVPPSLESAVRFLYPKIKQGIRLFSHLPPEIIHRLAKNM